MQATRIIRVGQVPLACGLDWIPLLGDPAGAKSQARRHGATHYIFSGSPAGALGLASGLRARTRYWSAAELFALRYPRGTVVCVLALDESSWYVLACHEGVVLARGDRIFLESNLAREAVESLRLAYPRLSVLTAEEGDGMACLRTLAAESATAPPLERLPRWRRRTVVGLPLLALTGLLGFRGMLAADTDERVQARERDAWTQAIAQVMEQRSIHGEAGTWVLLRALYRQPALIAGWRLHSVHCQPQAGRLAWSCEGDYRRAYPGADNRGLLREAPEDWRLDFPSLDHARARWPLRLPGTRPDAIELPVRGELSRGWASALQGILPAFTQLRVRPPTRVPIPAPIVAQGAPLAEPPDLPRLSVRAVTVQGPLRSAALMAPYARTISWRKASLFLSDGARSDVRASRLTVSLEGDAYERQ